jgi:hypothetical protein
MFRNERTGSARAHSTAAPAPISSDRTIRTASEASNAFFSACAAISTTSAPRKTTCATVLTLGPIRPSNSSIPRRSSGGSTTRRTEKLMMSKPLEPRAAKNSGLSFSRSKSG